MISVSHKQAEDLRRLLQEVGLDLVRQWPGTPGAKALTIITKDNGSPVTNADVMANERIVAALRKMFPNSAVLSEEGPQELEGTQGIWILDPLDGTKSFIEGGDDFSILLAYAQAGVPQWGIFHAPVRGLTVHAKRGGGAWLDSKRLAVSDSAHIRTGALYQRHCPELVGDAAVYARSMDSGLALLQVCQGIFDGAVIRVLNHREWDLAAPTLLIEESGGRVTTETGAAIYFGANDIQWHYYVASNGQVHDELLQKIRTTCMVGE